MLKKMTHLKFKFLFSITALFYVFLANAQQNQVEAVFETDQIELGEPTVLNIIAFVQQGQKVQFPFFENNQIIPEIDILNNLGVDTLVRNDSLFYRQRYQVSAYIDSIFYIDSLYIRIDKDTFKTPPAILFVNPYRPDSALLSQADTTKMVPLFGIEQPLHTPFTVAEFMHRFGWYVLVALVVFALFFVIRYYVKKRRKNEPIIVKPKKIIPPHIEALQKLDELKAKKLWQQDKPKQFHTELTEIVRHYIERRFEIMALETTTENLLEQFNAFSEFTTEAQTLRQMLVLADLVKFAKLHPLPDQNHQSLQQAYLFVENTKKMPQQTPETKTPEENENTEQAENKKEA